MFTGIVKGKFPIVDILENGGQRTVTVELSHELASGLKIGASVSVSGACMTARSTEGNRMTFDVMKESLQKTTLGQFKIGDLVNIERSLRFGDEVGGHIMSGHVYGMAKIIRIERSEKNRIVNFEVDPAWMEYILPKGFIGIDGCSLTVVDTWQNGFNVHLIPETLELTTFSNKKEGDFVNIELDPQTQAIVETVKRVLTEKSRR